MKGVGKLKIHVLERTFLHGVDTVHCKRKIDEFFVSLLLQYPTRDPTGIYQPVKAWNSQAILPSAKMRLYSS